MILRDPATLVTLNLVDRIWEWRKRLTGLLLGPEHSTAARIRATVALGGMSDCVVEHAGVPFEEVRAAAVDAALAALAH
nr:hypothetical protein GCM10020093_070230 [Planobispora longispora]